MSDKVYYGRGNSSMFDEYMDFINYVFGFNGNSSDFKKLLPKLYKPEIDPCKDNYVAVENGHILAAIGAYDSEFSVCGEVLKCRGIGNVAVHPYQRSRGFMKKLMTMAVDDMVADGVDFSALGGRRQRYNYFSYDRTGLCIDFEINDDNVRHKFGNDRSHMFDFRTVSAEDTDLLEKIKSLSEKQSLYVCRNTAPLYDILITWRRSIYAAFAGDEFAGYVVGGGDHVAELLLEDEYVKDVVNFCADYYDFIGSGYSLRMPMYLLDYIKPLMPFCESYSIGNPESFSVLNYRNTVNAFLKLKATYTKLPDGELTLKINGRGGAENITVSVRNGVPTVELTDKAPVAEYDHMDAMNALFGFYSPIRETLPDFARIWLPLPLFMYSTDGV